MVEHSLLNDITEFGKPPKERVAKVLSAIENSNVMIAAIHGTALGGGFGISRVSLPVYD